MDECDLLYSAEPPPLWVSGDGRGYVNLTSHKPALPQSPIPAKNGSLHQVTHRGKFLRSTVYQVRPTPAVQDYLGSWLLVAWHYTWSYIIKQMFRLLCFVFLFHSFKLVVLKWPDWFERLRHYYLLGHVQLLILTLSYQSHFFCVLKWTVKFTSRCVRTFLSVVFSTAVLLTKYKGTMQFAKGGSTVKERFFFSETNLSLL